MLRKKLKRLACIAIITLFSASLLAGCGTSSKSGGSGGKQTTLNIYMFGTFKNTDKVVKKFEKETKDTLNIKLNIKVMPAADYKQKLPLMISSGENIDLCFDAYWMNLSNLASQGAYADLSSYFNNSKYPGLKKAFSKQLLKDSAIDGKDLAIPIRQSPEDAHGVFITKNVREKLGIGEIKTMDDLENYLAAVKKNEKALNVGVVLSTGGSTRGYWGLGSDDYEKRKANIFQFGSTGGLEFEIALNDSGKKVESVTMLGDDAAAFASRKSPFNKDTRADYYSNFITKIANEYGPKDPLAQSSGAPTYAGAGVGNLSEFSKNLADLKKNFGQDKELEFFPVGEPVRSMEKSGIVEPIQSSSNFVCIPKNSTKKDTTMKFLDWLYSSKANHDLFEFGIEGDDWKAVGSDQYKLLTSKTQYTFAPYELTWNQSYVRTLASLPDEIKKYTRYQVSEDSYVPNPMAGFVFNTSKVKNEYAALNAVLGKYAPLFLCGVNGNKTNDTIKKFHSDAEAAGLEKVRDELKTQIETYLKTKK